MGKRLRVGEKLWLPEDMVTGSFALLAMKGAGKSNAAVVIAERMFDAGLPWVAIDPKGDWWGIRSDADGGPGGLPVPILGGLHGDLPLDPDAGGLIADLVVDENLSCVLDVSDFGSKNEQIRFLLAFGQQLFKRHGREPQPRMLFLEECDEYLPQRVTAQMAPIVGCYSKVVKQGRQRGLGITLISQRSAVVNKDALTQTETLIAMRATHKLDRNAVRDWLSYHAESDDVADSLPSLENGEAWIVSPHYLKRVERTSFFRRATFDSGGTPVVGKSRRVATLADVDLGRLQAEMQSTIEKAAENDPVALRAQLAIAQRAATDARMALHQTEQALTAMTENRDLMAVALEAEQAQARDDMNDDIVDLRNIADQWREDILHAQQIAESVLKAVSNPGVQTPTPPAPPKLVAVPTPAPTPTNIGGKAPILASDLQLKAGARRILDVVVGNHPVGYTKSQVGVLAGFKVSGGTFRDYWRALTVHEEVLYEDEQGLVRPTDKGLAVAAQPGPGDRQPVYPNAPTSTDDVVGVWRQALKAGARKMLDMLVERHGAWVEKDALCRAAGFEPSGGTARDYVRSLVKNGLADQEGDKLRASAAMFPGAAQ